MRLEGKVAIVTGAGAGIGRAIALRLAQEGSHIVVVDRNRSSAQETSSMVERTGHRALVCVADVARGDQVQSAVDATLEEFGRIDVLVNNAGVVTFTPFLDLPEAEWDLVIDTNLKGPFLFSQAVARAMIPAGRPGSIVNIGSAEGEVVVASGVHCQPHYNASKGGVKMLTKALAFELAPYNIRVNGVSPGPIETGFAGGLHEVSEAQEKMLRRLLIKRRGRPVEVASVVAFLASDESSYMTGAMVAVDGGWLVT